MQDEDRRRHSGRRVRLLFASVIVACVLSHYLPASCAQLSSVVGGAGDGGVAEHPAVYIVHVRKPKRMLYAGPKKLEAWHRSFLPSPALDSGEPRLVFSYSRAMSGFAARLTPEEAEAMAAKDGVLVAVRDRALIPQTTHTPDFLRLRPDLWRAANRGEGIIVGMVDTGINPDHVSFEGAKGRRPPWKWRGYCEFYGRRTCNRKLVGARSYYAGGGEAAQPLPYDVNGHGTHTAGAAVGKEVGSAGVYGYANGTAAGAAPAAHLAVYKAGTVAEVLAAINQAIHDRVDVLCLPMASLDGGAPYYLDGVAIGALAAVREGIFVVAAAGNYGPSLGTLRNEAPWIMTVAASTTDRVLRASLRLGNGQELAGESLFHDDTDNVFDQLPLVYPMAKRLPAAMACSDLRGVKAAGKIVLCHTGGNISTAEKAKAVKDAGGIAMVMMNSQKRGFTIAELPDVDLPTVAVDYNTSLQLVDYLTRSLHPSAAVVPGGTAYQAQRAPAVAGFSSRGPSAINGGILKPDVLAPGVSIVSASHAAKTGFFLDSGTSVAAAHVAGVAAIVNKSNADWTPAMIRSAIMTTTTLMDGAGDPIADQTGSAANLLATGAGQVDPPRATDPGLVYNVDFGDYVRYLCGLGYTDAQASITAGYSVQCAAVGKVAPEQLNYPSIAARLAASSPAEMATVRRTLTNVLQCSTSTYRAKVELPPGVAAKVSPRRLFFWRRGQRRRFTVTFSLDNSSAAVLRGDVLGGRLWWYSGTHVIATPLLITVV